MCTHDRSTLFTQVGPTIPGQGSAHHSVPPDTPAQPAKTTPPQPER